MFFENENRSLSLQNEKFLQASKDFVLYLTFYLTDVDVATTVIIAKK